MVVAGELVVIVVGESVVELVDIDDSGVQVVGGLELNDDTSATR